MKKHRAFIAYHWDDFTALETDVKNAGGDLYSVASGHPRLLEEAGSFAELEKVFGMYKRMRR